MGIIKAYFILGIIALLIVLIVFLMTHLKHKSKPMCFYCAHCEGCGKRQNGDYLFQRDKECPFRYISSWEIVKECNQFKRKHTDGIEVYTE